MRALPGLATDDPSSGKCFNNHLVLLPGLDGTGSLFGPLLKNLPSRFIASVVTYPCDKAYSYQQLLPRIREAIPCGHPYTLVAESFSGPLALLFAAEPREDLRAVVLCASFVTNPIHPVLDWGRFLLKDSLFRKSLPQFLLRKYLIGDDCPAALIADLQAAIQSVRPDVLAHRIRMALDTDVSDALRSCQKPILYLLGERDKIVGRRGLDTITSIRPTIKSLTIDAPHLLLQRKPNEAIAAIDKFLQEAEAR